MNFKLLFLSFALGIFQSFNAQISPLPNIGSQWSMASFGMFGINQLDPIVYTAFEFIEIEDQTYTQIGDGYFREENDQWFCIAENDSIEHLLFDFSLEAGDTLFFFNPFIDSTSTTEESLRADYSIVESTDLIELENGEIRKRLNMLSHVLYEIGDTLIEEESLIAGIGSTQNTFRFGYLGEQLDDDHYELICFRNENKELLYENPVEGIYNGSTNPQPIIYENCDWSVNVEELDLNSPVLISPNPSQDFVRISLPRNFYNNFILEIHDPIGNLVLVKDRLSNDTILDVSDLSPGIYSICLTDEQGVRFTGRFIKN